jgi:formylglycine-generating enzyme required for sulfatase activity
MEVPDLELLVEEQPGSDGRGFDLRLKARDPELDLNYRPVGSIRLRAEPGEFFRRQIAEIWRGRPRTAEEWASLADLLKIKGAFFSDTILPSELKRRLSDLRGKARSLLIQSDDPWIPWEMLCLPENPGCDDADGPFLCEAFAMTRWLRTIRLTLFLPLRRMAVVVPRNSGLSHAEGEYEDLLSLSEGETRRVERIPAKLSILQQEFCLGKHDGWHFTGHGIHRESAPDLSAIWLEGGDELTPVHLSGGAKKMGAQRPLVFLNACSTGKSGMSLTEVGGWAPHFLRAGAGACIGTLWPIDDGPARTFARIFYSSFIAGATISESVLTARQAVRSEDNPTWLAYTVFAHPLALCTPSVPLRVRCPENSDGLATPQNDHSLVLSAAPPAARRTKTAPLPRASKKRKGVVNRPLDLPATDQKRRLCVEVIEPPKPARKKLEEPAPGEERVNEKDGTVLVYVPGGEHTLGAEGIDRRSRPIRRVRLSPFWIGKFPLTNEQFSRFLKENPHRPKPAFWEDLSFNQPQQPVVGVSWEEAQAYCHWAGLELPSEAQWEAAARGTDQRPYPWGKEMPTNVHANFNGACCATTPVGSHPAGIGPYGTFDQAGNVWEWCRDPWDSQAYQQWEDGQVDPLAKGEPAVRALRGGSWRNPFQNLHAAYRERTTAKLRFNTHGFRCSLQAV